MTNNFMKLINQKNDCELIECFLNTSGYQPEFLTLAVDEIVKRNIDLKKIETKIETKSEAELLEIYATTFYINQPEVINLLETKFEKRLETISEAELIDLYFKQIKTNQNIEPTDVILLLGAQIEKRNINIADFILENEYKRVFSDEILEEMASNFKNLEKFEQKKLLQNTIKSFGVDSNSKGFAEMVVRIGTRPEKPKMFLPKSSIALEVIISSIYKSELFMYYLYNYNPDFYAKVHEKAQIKSKNAHLYSTTMTIIIVLIGLWALLKTC